jgi:hypothetical protein
VLLIATYFAHQKDRIQDEPSYDRSKEDDAQENANAFAPVEDDPSKANCDRDRGQTHAQ